MEREQRLSLNRSKLRKILLKEDCQEIDSLIDTSGNGLRGSSTLWVLADQETPEEILGASLLELTAHENLHLVIYFENLQDAQITQRRSNALKSSPSIFFFSNGKANQVEPALFDERKFVEPPLPEFEELCLKFDLEKVYEFGTWSGEIFGLEVLRVFDNEIQVGVGKLDREANSLISRGKPVSDVLSSAVEIVRLSRNSESSLHPLSRLVRERWLRADAVANPREYGMESLILLEPPIERKSLRDSMPTAAMGFDEKGEKVLYVFSVGIDIRLVPFIADLVLLELPDRVEVVIPNKDILVPIEKSLKFLNIPLTIRGVVGGWERSSV